MDKQKHVSPLLKLDLEANSYATLIWCVSPHHSLLYTVKAWQFDDGAIECPVADLEREDLVAQSIKEPFLGDLNVSA